ncbi:MAG: DNRLRE domain-containing protein [Candidatus Azobacteroides sp.]|nr:DNRLRE domain-containing protein [Candidatus Azobacteroides sp.]
MKKNRIKYITGIVLAMSLSPWVFSQPVPDCNDPFFFVSAARYDKSDKSFVPYVSRVVCQLPEFDMEETFVEKNKYGSRTDRKAEATGFFRVEKIDGRWWVVDPEGYLQINVGVCAVNKNESPRNKKAFQEKYNNSREAWMRDTKQTLKDHGFYTFGAWTASENIKVDKDEDPMPYTPIYNFATTYASRRTNDSYERYGYDTYTSSPSGNNILHIFDPEFEDFCDHFAKTSIRPFDKDADVLGFFSDNELPFSLESLKQYLQVADKTYPGYLAAKEFVETNGYSVSEYLAGKDLAGAPKKISQLKDEWTGVMGERYYSVVSAAIKKYAPNHMYLGSRLYRPSLEFEGLVTAAAKYCDIISFNTYSAWDQTKERAFLYGLRGDKPFIATEFYAKGEDVFDTKGNKFPNTSGAGYVVKTQVERGYYYQTFCLGMLEAKNCVGWHHFKYMDNDPEDTGNTADPSNIDSNKGLVDNEYNFYTDMMDQMKILNDRLYNIVDYFDSYPVRRPVGEVNVIYPEADANYKEGENEGKLTTLSIKEASPYRQALVRFDITSISEEAAYVGFNLVGTRVVTDPEVNIYAIDIVEDNDWEEEKLYKNNIPVSSHTGIHLWSSNTGTTADVTKYVKWARAQGKDKITFKLRVSLQATSDYMSFGSREAEADKRPTLVYAMDAESSIGKLRHAATAYCAPNPAFNGQTSLYVDNDTACMATIMLYNIHGQRMKTIYQGSLDKYRAIIPFETDGTGMYYVRIKRDDQPDQVIKVISR